VPVYLLSSGDARCAASGCRCHDRVRAYPSDTTGAQWAVLEPEVRAAMAELVKAEGRPMEHDLRAMCDAVFYVVKNGVEWRALPVDFPPHEAVWKFFGRWSARGLPRELTGRLRRRLRERQGRGPDPTAVIVDSQIVKAADTVGKASRGFHGGKKINGRGRHVAVDVEGWLLAIVVTAASVSDRAGARLLVARLVKAFTTLRVMWADSCYDAAPLATWIKTTAGITLEIIKRSDLTGFQLVARRWVVERTFGWLMRYRRLARDYERRTDHHEAMVYWATVMIMTRRLARYQAGQPPEPRWGGERQTRAQPQAQAA
jgi:transposase